MKILIITDQVGRTAPGIVFERLILGLSWANEIDLCVSNLESSLNFSKVKRIYRFRKNNYFPRFNKFLFTFFGIHVFDSFSALNAIKSLSKDEIIKYDFVFVFLSFNHYSSLLAGIHLKKNFQKRLIVYSVDAIPAPIGWLKNDMFYFSLTNFIKKCYDYVDVLYSSNPKMLEYQLKVLNNKNFIYTGILLSPNLIEKSNYPLSNDGIYRFVYTGGIYGLRTSKYLLEGFNLLLKYYPQSKLIFVGTKFDDNTLSFIENHFSENVEIYPFASDLSKFYKDSTALIDIDASVDNDVFLSSKIVNYLMINRIIICETGSNSPSRFLFEGVGSIIRCDHNSEELCDAMKKAIQIQFNIDFEDRKDVISKFNLNNVIEKLNIELSKLTYTG